MVKDGGKAIRHAGGLEMEQSGTVSLGPKVKNQHVQVTWPEDISDGRSQRKQREVRQRMEKQQMGNRKEEKSDRAEEMPERRE